MEVERVAMGAPAPLAGENEAKQAAKKLQVALFTEMLKHGGLADAFSTGSDSLDSLGHAVIEKVAEDMASSENALAERLYSQMRDPR